MEKNTNKLFKYFKQITNNLLSKFNHLKSFNNTFLVQFKHLKLFSDKLLTNTLKKFRYYSLRKNTKKVSNFNKALILFITLIFCYIFYLTVPTLYDKLWVQRIIEKKLIKEFNINFNLSSDITYVILPTPHFVIKDVIILDYELENKKKIADIKTLKVFISQKNFFDKDSISLRNIQIENANFLFKNDNLNFLSILIDKRFSNKKIDIIKSNIFFKSKDDEETLFINKLIKARLSFDEKKLLNTIFFNSEIFNIPFSSNITNNITDKELITKIESKKIKFYLKDKLNNKEKIKSGYTELSIINSKLIHNYTLDKNLFSFKSSKSYLQNNNISYEGKINLDPFNLLLDISLEKIDLSKFFEKNSILMELLKSEIFFNDNINLFISLYSPLILDHKILKKLELKFSVDQGNINFDKTKIELDKIASSRMLNSKLISKNGEVELSGEIIIEMKDLPRLYRFLQTNKNSRKIIKEINVSFNYNIQKDEIRFNSIIFDDIEPSQEIINELINFNSKKIAFKNMIEFKNYVNKIFSIY